MLTKREEDFIRYWGAQRLRRKQFFRNYSVGLPLAVFLVLALFINFLSGWYQKADMVLRANSSLIIVVLVAALGIVVFITWFAMSHKWDQNELYYQELLRKKEAEDNMQKLPHN